MPSMMIAVLSFLSSDSSVYRSVDSGIASDSSQNPKLNSQQFVSYFSLGQCSTASQRKNRKTSSQHFQDYTCSTIPFLQMLGVQQ